MSPTAPRSTPGSRLPRAGVDPITDEATALALVETALAWPPRPETIVVLLDDARCGIGLVVVSGTVDDDAVLEVADRILDPEVHAGRVAAAIIATVRVRRIDPAAHDELPDADRWIELDEIVTSRGVELIEWFVLGDRVSRPRDLVHAPPRW